MTLKHITITLNNTDVSDVGMTDLFEGLKVLDINTEIVVIN